MAVATPTKSQQQEHRVEQRMITTRLELRDALPDGSIPFSGHAAVFNSRSQVLQDWWDQFQEVITPGAFASNLQQDVRLLINHDPNLVLARTTSGTLRLSEDSIGLLCEGELAPTSYARDLQLSMQRGDISQMSFAFEVAPDGDEWNIGADGMLLRTVNRVAVLYDASIVTYPAYEATDASTRSTLAMARAARTRLGVSQREGKRNSAADEAAISAAIALCTEGLASEQEQDDDPAAVTRFRQLLSILDGLLVSEASEDEGDEEDDGEEESAAEPMTDDGERSMQALRHNAIARRYGLAHQH